VFKVRLVDAVSFISFMKNYQKEVAATGTDGEYNLLERIIRGMENEPTAYDPDNVITEIEEKSRVMSTKDLPHKYHRAIGTRVCEEIIRRGGV